MKHENDETSEEDETGKDDETGEDDNDEIEGTDETCQDEIDNDMMKLMKLLRMTSYLFSIIKFCNQTRPEAPVKRHTKLPPISEEDCDAVITIVCRTIIWRKMNTDDVLRGHQL